MAAASKACCALGAGSHCPQCPVRCLATIVPILEAIFDAGLDITNEIFEQVSACCCHGRRGGLFQLDDALNDRLESTIPNGFIPNLSLIYALLALGAIPNQTSSRWPLETLIDHLDSRFELIGRTFLDLQEVQQ